MRSSLLFSTAIVLVLLFSCSGKNDKKEAAERYLRSQTIDYKEPVSNAESSDTGIVKVITDKIFDKTISKGVSLVDFWATWCKPCRLQAPIIEQLATEYKGKIKFYKMDVDENYNVPNRFKIASIPTLIVFKDGVQVEKFVGLQDLSTLQNALVKYK